MLVSRLPRQDERSNFDSRPRFGRADGLGDVGVSDIDGGDGQKCGPSSEGAAVCSQNGMNCCQDSVIVLIRVVEYGRLTHAASLTAPKTAQRKRQTASMPGDDRSRRRDRCGGQSIIFNDDPS
jgi:hypothetical protein